MIKKIKKTKSHTEVAQLPNLIRQKSDWSKVLLTDITYIPMKGKWVYLASLYHLVTRRVIAHRVGANMTKELATSVLEKVNLRVQGIEIAHSDIGSQYTGDLFNQTLKKKNKALLFKKRLSRGQC